MHDTAAVITTRAARHTGTWIVLIEQAFTLPSIFPFQERVAFLKSHEVVKAWIVDLTAVPYIDSAGLGCLINLYVSANKNGQKFGLVGTNQRVLALLETAKVHTMLHSYGTVAEAEAALATA